MSLPSQARVEFECAICGADCVDVMDRVAKRHPKDSICQVCEERCDEQAEAAVIGLMVDSVTHTGKGFADTGKGIANPYTRTHAPIPAMCRCYDDYREEYRPPVTRSNNWLGLFIAVVLVIGAGVVLGRWAG